MESGNAVIREVFVGIEGHGIPTMNIELEMRGARQSFGGYDLRFKDTAAVFVSGICRIAEVQNVHKAVGNIVRYERDGVITRIGHPIHDVWLSRDQFPK